jgi:hypothetical protein
MAGDWTLLARNGTGTSVSRCPEGHIHLEYGTTNIKLDDRCFLELAGVVCEAARRLGEPEEGCERSFEGARRSPRGN